MPDWDSSEIIRHPGIDRDDQRVRAGAARIHRNESLHRHDHEGVVCVYCALNASHVVRAIDEITRHRRDKRLMGSTVSFDFGGFPGYADTRVRNNWPMHPYFDQPWNEKDKMLPSHDQILEVGAVMAAIRALTDQMIQPAAILAPMDWMVFEGQPEPVELLGLPVRRSERDTVSLEVEVLKFEAGA